MYKNVCTIHDGYVVGTITARDGNEGRPQHSFSVGRSIRGADAEQKVTFWFQAKHFPAIRKMLDRLELEMVKLEEQAS